MIVDCAVYEHGRRQRGRDLALRGIAAPAGATARSCGWGCSSPARRSSTRWTAEFGLHPLAVEDAVKAHQRPKLEVYDDTLFVVLKPVRYIDSRGGRRDRGDRAVRQPGVRDLGAARQAQPAAGGPRRASTREPELVARAPARSCTRSSTGSSTTTSRSWRASTADIQEIEEQVFCAGPHTTPPSGSTSSSARCSSSERAVDAAGAGGRSARCAVTSPIVDDGAAAATSATCTTTSCGVERADRRSSATCCRPRCART